MGLEILSDAAPLVIAEQSQLALERSPGTAMGEAHGDIDRMAMAGFSSLIASRIYLTDSQRIF